jgi:putative ABC transport system permease protein
MVLIQFVLSALLISSSVWIFSQVNYLKNKDLGFTKENLLHVAVSQEETTMDFTSFKNIILSNPGIEKVSISKDAPLCHSKSAEIYFEGQSEIVKIAARRNYVNADFVETLGIQLISGNNFRENPQQNQNTCLINETAIEASGWKDNPLGKFVYMNGETYKVIGIVKDFHAHDVHNEIIPNLLLPHSENMSEAHNLIFKINPNSFTSSYEHIKNTISKAYPDNFFRILRYDNAMRKKAINIWSSASDTFTLFTGIAILIAIFALFALVIFAIQKRKKEIGVRKVQGAKFFQIYYLLIKEFIFIVLIAAVIALPAPEILARTMPGAYKYHLQIHHLQT